MRRINSITICTFSILIIAGIFFHFPMVESQSADRLPVILIHGYRQDESSWNTWEELLQRDGIPFYSASFEDDMCGSAVDHAKELNKIVDFVKQQEESDKINMVGFSKGGLDARVYLQDGNDNVANLIMIGTPNDGAPLAQFDFLWYSSR